MRKMRDWREYLIERFTIDREEAIGFLQAVLEDYPVYGDVAAVVSALTIVVESQGGVAEVAKRTAMAPETLSKILSDGKALHLDTLTAVLKALGCQLSIEPLKDDENATADAKLAVEAESTKFGDSQTQLAEPDVPQ